MSRTGAARPLAVALIVGAVAASVWQAVFAVRISVNDGCGMDGSQYCKLFFGQPAPEPFSRRVLTPCIAHLLSGEPVPAFFVVNLAAVAGIVALAVLLLRAGGDNGGLGRLRAASGVEATLLLGLVAAVLATRNLLHLALTYPVLSDPLALLLMMVALWGLVRARESWVAVGIGVVAAALAPLARETTGLAVAGTAVVGLVLARRRPPNPWPRYVAFLVAAVVGTVVAFTRPTSAAAGGLASVVLDWVRTDLTTAAGLVRFAVMLLIGLGFSWLLLLAPEARRGWTPADILIGACAATFLAVSVFGGGDTDRIVMPAGVLLLVLSARIAARRPSLLLPAVALMLAYVVAQYPFTVVGPSLDDYLGFFALRVSERIDLINNGAAPVLLGAVVALAVVLSVRRPPTPLPSADPAPTQSET